MCIILGQVSSVSSTHLFVVPSVSGTRQLTVYKNTVDSPEDNLMVLPIPHPESLELHKLKYKKLFSQLRDSVESLTRGPSYPYPLGSLALTRSCSAVLPVYDYGSYKVSVALTLEDLFRLDTTVFELPEGSVDFFAKHYSREFGYLCCQLKPGKKEYEPVCYSHDLHSSGKLFVPTLHYHIHEGHTHTDAADWDHSVYSVGTTPVANLGYRSKSENEVVWSKLPEGFQWRKTDPIRLARITGHHPNHDLSFALAKETS